MPPRPRGELSLALLAALRRPVHPLLDLRRRLEEPFERALRETVAVPPATEPDAMDLALRAIADADDGPSLSTHLEREAPLEHVIEFLVHRSAYQLKEADPHSWAL